ELVNQYPLLRNPANGESPPPFKSAKELKSLVERMGALDGLPSWSHCTIDGELPVNNNTLYFRDPVAIIRYILQQPYYRNVMIYSACRDFHCGTERIYHEMNSAEWWWNIEVSQPAAKYCILVESTD